MAHARAGAIVSIRTFLSVRRIYILQLALGISRCTSDFEEKPLHCFLFTYSLAACSSGRLCSNFLAESMATFYMAKYPDGGTFEINAQLLLFFQSQHFAINVKVILQNADLLLKEEFYNYKL